MNEETQATQPESSAPKPAQQIPVQQLSPEDAFDEQERLKIEEMIAQNGFGEAPPATNAGIAQPPERERTPEQEQAAADKTAAIPPEPAKKPSVLPKTDPRLELARLRNEMRSRDGKHGREVELLNKENETLKQQLAEINKRLADREEERKQAENANVKLSDMTDEELRKEFGEDDVEINGADTYRTMLKVAQYVASRIAASKGSSSEDVGKLVKAEIASLREESRLESVMDEVEREMPGYRQLNEQAAVNGFATYLDELFPGTQFTRREVAENALARVAGTARTDKGHVSAMKTLENIVRGFANPSPNKPATTSPAPNAGRPRFDASRYVTPRPVATTPAPKATGSQRQYTEDELGAMRAKALAEGDDAYDRFEALEMELRRTGRVTA